MDGGAADVEIISDFTHCQQTLNSGVTARTGEFGSLPFEKPCCDTEKDKDRNNHKNY